MGSIIGKVVAQDLSENFEILGVFSRKLANAKTLSNKIECKAYESLSEVIEDRLDYIVEAATPAVFKDIGIEILAKGINLIPLSVRALADKDFYNQVHKTALENNCQVHVPAGAVGGFDVLRFSMLMENAKVNITTEKSPESLNGAPFLNGKTLSEVNEEEIFSGNAKEAIKHFPKNINVAVATALATAGVENTKVSIKSIPHFNNNRHTIQLSGETVKVEVSVETKPSKNNPKSSTLAAYSVISLLKDLVAPITF